MTAKRARLIRDVVLVLFTLAMAGLVYAHRNDPGTLKMVKPPKPPKPPVAAPRSTVLVERYGCWSGPAPADMEGKYPGHVVVTLPNGKTVYSARLVAKALAQQFDGEKNGLDIHAFCR